jgi:ethanolamine ammonia-lyase small subunit
MAESPIVDPHRGDGDAADVWAPLRRLTAARIGLASTGASLATAPLLDFRLAHARARDAVAAALDEPKLLADLQSLGLSVVAVSSAVTDRAQYLLRPDLGRQLAAADEALLAAQVRRFDVAFVVTEGLSAHAVQSHARPVLVEVLPALANSGWRIAPLVLARRGRVAIGDAIAGALGANSVVVLIGERPGLTAPNSMGAYLTWQPRPQTTDADRNCISNIRPDGIGYADAAFKLVHLLQTMRARRISGVALKDTTDRLLAGDP